MTFTQATTGLPGHPGNIAIPWKSDTIDPQFTPTKIEEDKQVDIDEFLCDRLISKVCNDIIEASSLSYGKERSSKVLKLIDSLMYEIEPEVLS